MDFFSNLVGYAGTLLQIILLFLIVRGPFRRYFPLFLYVLSYAITTLAQAWVLQKWGPDLEHYFPVYWGAELYLDLVLFMVMIMLTLRVLEGNPVRAKVAQMMIVGVVVVLTLPFLVFESRVYTTRWNDSTSQLLNFAAAVMNLVLWGALIVTKNRDRQLMTVTAGLGVALAGAAATLGMRNLSDENTTLRTVVDYLHRFLFIASVLIWCWAFRPRRAAPSKTAPV